ncbi:zf-TFIIB domain-containing protein [Ferribacterium limneticum]|uniref:zf-TFIIB domain-containing protein n=1 Tax=Ferribacterium limneticum TaxID=76259 RepID=UPI001CFA9142|nr:zf-TFIIB domain-containing protein [Ferribacterium limneticum]UCV26919.1 zf-TFIIB domain-containing protein [Ferribacterium limneticum]UCV30836.1 zf-TFIIB domain-containing protein [Ferribacterium limneticum]
MKPLPCPSCQQTMTKHRLERLHHGEVVLDLCFHCQGIWFDEFESAQITPGGIIEFFKLLHEHHDDQRTPLRDPLKCPRCNERLLHGLDVAKHGGQFNYHRCLQKHGRFTTFAQFMIEKGFVRQLNPAEIDELAAKVGIIRCMGCGAPVDIRKDHACGHCRAPITILDSGAVEQALSRYQHAEVHRTTRDVELLGDAIVMREREKSRLKRMKQEPENAGIIDTIDLISAGAEFVWNIIKR